MTAPNPTVTVPETVTEQWLEPNPSIFDKLLRRVIGVRISLSKLYWRFPKDYGVRSAKYLFTTNVLEEGDMVLTFIDQLHATKFALRYA